MQSITVIGHATVWFNVTRDSRFFKWNKEAELVQSRYFVQHHVEVQCKLGDPWLMLLAEEMFRQGNADYRINGKTERSISVGDVIEIRVTGLGTEAMACEPFGFEQINLFDWFLPSTEARRRRAHEGELVG
jgi:hypothetical protein